jgi:hypothetical protein
MRKEVVKEGSINQYVSYARFTLFTQFYQNLFSAVRGLKLLSEDCFYHLNIN